MYEELILEAKQVALYCHAFYRQAHHRYYKLSLITALRMADVAIPGTRPGTAFGQFIKK